MTQPPIDDLLPFVRRLGLDLSLQALPDLDAAHAAQLARFVRSVPALGAEAGEVASFEVTLGARMDRLVWRAAGAPSLFAPWIASTLTQPGSDPARVAQLGVVARLLHPTRLGAWISASPHGMSLGWHCPDPAPLASAMASAPLHDAAHRLIRWTRANRQTQCLHTSVCVAAQTPFWDVVVALDPEAAPAPNDDPALLVHGALRALGVALPDAAIARLCAIGDLALTARITLDGFARVGVRAYGPDTAAVLQLLTLARRGAPPDDALAELQGALLTRGPDMVEWFLDADGHSAELHYAFTGTTPALH